MTSDEQLISRTYAYGTREDLYNLSVDFLNKRKKLGAFIDKFLETFDDVMSLAPHDHPTWKLFRVKHAEYGEMERNIKSVNYFLNKND